MNHREGKKDTCTRLDQMLSKLRGHALRLTPQRVAILTILADSQGHPSAEEIHRAVKMRFPATSLATVYNTVSMLKELNEVLELGFPGGSNRYDGNRPYPHPHVICTSCKKIMDPELVHLGKISEEMSVKTGYRIFSHRLDFFGLCPECQGKESSG